MKKKGIIAVISLVAAAGISIGAFAAVKSRNDKDVKEQEKLTAENQLLSYDPDSINKLTITTDGVTITAELVDDVWTMTDSTCEPFELNQTKLQAICTYISKLTAASNYGELSDENRAKYGMDDPYIVTLSDGTTESTLYIGDLSPTSGYYYACTDSKQSIYAVAESTVGFILADKLDLKSDSLLPYSDSDLRGIQVRLKDGSGYDFTFDPETGQWSLPAKYDKLMVNQTRPSAITTLVTRLSAEEMLPEDTDLNEYGFNDPDARLKITAADGSERNIRLRYYGKDAKTYVYVYIEEDDQVEKYYTADFNFLNFSIFDLIMRKVECGSMYGVSAFEFTTEQLSESFTVDPVNDKAECRGMVIDLANAEEKSFYENFFNYVGYITFCDADIDAEPALEEPVFSSKFTDLNGKVTTYDLVSADDTRAYVFYNGRYTGTLADTGFLTGDDSLAAAYEMLCRHSALEPQ